MGFRDYFGDDLQEDDYEDFDENNFKSTERVLAIDDKEYYSLDKFKKEVETQDLEDYVNFIDEEIIKTDRKFRFISISKIMFKVLTCVSVGALLISNFFKGKPKEILKIASTSVGIYSLIGVCVKTKRESELSDELEDLYDVFNELDDELLERQTKTKREYNCIEIFG